MLALAQRFEGGRLSARDCVRIIGAGLRGGGHEVTDTTVASMKADGGIAGYVDIVARLLTITFASPSPSPRLHTDGFGRLNEGRPPTDDNQRIPPRDVPGEVIEPRPFLGTT
jgi:hypothetical protein